MRVTLYRGDDEPFTQFDKNMIGRNCFNTVGFWFTDNREAAEFYGEHIRPFIVTYNVPMEVSYEEFKNIREGPNHWARLAFSQGYDACMIHDIVDGNVQSTVTC